MINTIKTSKTLRLAIVSAGLVLGIASHSTYAAGTASNTDINNIAKLSYTVGGVAQNEICSSSLVAGNTTSTGLTSGSVCTTGVNGALVTTFKVDNKVNLTVIEKNASPTIVVPGATNSLTVFTVTNNGNTVQDYGLSATATGMSGSIFTGPALADNFDATNCLAYVESGANVGYLAAEDSLFIDELAPDASRDVTVKCDIPVSRVNNDVSIVQLTATTLIGGTASTQGGALVIAANTQGGVEIVLADPATAATADGTRPLQTAGDAIGTARDAYKVESAVLSVAKVATPICDPINAFAAGPKNIPGAAVQYAITITNTGLAPALLTTITDTLDTNLSFLAAGVTTGGPACVPAPALASGFGAVNSASLTTTYAAPGLASEVTTAGATVAGQAVTINYATLATSAITAPAAATLAAGASIPVYFNAFIK